MKLSGPGTIFDPVFKQSGTTIVSPAGKKEHLPKDILRAGLFCAPFSHLGHQPDGVIWGQSSGIPSFANNSILIFIEVEFFVLNVSW